MIAHFSTVGDPSSFSCRWSVCSAADVEALRAQMGEEKFWRFAWQNGRTKPRLRVKAGREVVD